jgi:hypothetical protein
MNIIYKKESGGLCIDSKSDETKLKKYFEEILPDYDKERVYASDIRKLFSWYNQLHAAGLLKLEEAKPEEVKSEETTAKEEKTEEK